MTKGVKQNAEKNRMCDENTRVHKALFIYLFYYENRTSCTHRGKKKKKKKTNKQTNKPKTHTMCQ